MLKEYQLYPMFLKFVQCILHKFLMCIRKLFNVYYKCPMHIRKLFNTYIHSFPKMFIMYNLKCSSYIKKMFNGYYKIFGAKYLQMFKSSSIHTVFQNQLFFQNALVVCFSKLIIFSKQMNFSVIHGLFPKCFQKN